PMRASIVSAGPVSTRVEKIGFGSHERPFVSPDLILSGTAFVDLHALCGYDHCQRFVRAGFELIRHLGHRHRWLQARASGDEEHQQEYRDLRVLGHSVLSLCCGLMSTDQVDRAGATGGEPAVAPEPAQPRLRDSSSDD